MSKFPLVVNCGGDILTLCNSLLAQFKPVIDYHFSFGDTTESLATAMYPLAACEGAVTAHTDDVVSDGVIVGFVLQSDGHVLHVEGAKPRPLMAGDIYIIEPLVKHWTECPDLMSSKLIFLASGHPRQGCLKTPPMGYVNMFKHAALEGFRLWEQSMAQEAEDDRVRYRGINAVS